MCYLIYLVFGKGNSNLISELIYSLLSFNKVAGEWSKKHIQIIIYTEEAITLPASLAHLGVKIIYLDEEEVCEWIRKGNGHALVVKARVMAAFLQQYSAPGLMIDTDTFFRKDPAPLFDEVQEGHLVMHMKEYAIVKRTRIYSFFQQKKFRQVNGKEYTVSPAFDMWNSGVIGLHPAYNYLMPDIISLIQQVALEKDWPSEEQRLIEQTVYSYFLQTQASELRAADEFIIHYWFIKPCRYLLGNYFNYFHGSDEAEFIQLMHMTHATRADFDDLSYDTIPLLMILLLRKNGALHDYLFECLPDHTYMGNILRASM